MKIGEVITLLKAGYTRAEIQEMKNSDSATVTPEVVDHPVSPDSAAAQAPAETALPGPETAAPDVHETPAPDAHAEEIAELRRLVDNLTKLIQKQNLRDAEIPKVEPQTAVDILASVINPKH
jgi:hypothetical protein